jgi:sporulation protein YlmC with PRC-barrel domain
MRSLEDVQTWRGRKVVDADGDKIGTIQDVFLDRQTGEPEWATVKTGLFGLKSSFVPITDAELVDDDTVRVPYQKEQVKDAPRVDDEDLSPEDERRLWEHYGRSDYDEWQGEDRTTALDLPARTASRNRSRPRWIGGAPVRSDTSAPPRMPVAEKLGSSSTRTAEPADTRSSV